MCLVCFSLDETAGGPTGHTSTQYNKHVETCMQLLSNESQKVASSSIVNTFTGWLIRPTRALQNAM